MPRDKSINKINKNNNKSNNKANIIKEKKEKVSQDIANEEDLIHQSAFMKDIDFICFIGIKCVSSLYRSIMTRLNKLLTFQKFESIFNDFSNFSHRVLEMKLATISRTTKGLSYLIKKITVQTLRECNKKIKSKMFSDKNDTTNKIKQENASQSESLKQPTDKINNLCGMKISIEDAIKLSLKFKKRRFNNKEKVIQSKFKNNLILNE